MDPLNNEHTEIFFRIQKTDFACKIADFPPPYAAFAITLRT